jgi:hypothetical protein
MSGGECSYHVKDIGLSMLVILLVASFVLPFSKQA